MKLQGAERIAALLLTLDRTDSAQLLRNLSEKDLNAVGRAMTALQDMVLPDELLTEILGDYFRRLQSSGLGGPVVSSDISGLFHEALGEEKGAQTLEEAYDATLSQKPFATLEELPGEDLMALLREEHPQVVALILSYLSTDAVCRVLAELPRDFQVDVVKRMATRDTASPDLVNEMARTVAEKVAGGGNRFAAGGGSSLLKSVADILNQIDAEVEKDILEGLRKNDPDLADSIEEHRFSFSDLINIDKKSTQQILSNVDTRTLALALKAADPTVEEHLLENMSKRSRENVTEEREVLGPVPLSEVLEAQKEILSTIRSLLDAGKIKITRGSDDTLVS